jgi:competence protein CoiA
MVNGEKKEAEKGLSGVCIGCEQPTIPKCGPIKVKHWAHKQQCECDHWWENETEWHRSWKNNFPFECQEIRHKAEDGEWHIADVKTKQGHILEFQHSFLKSEERIARNNFYGSSLVWVVDGNRRPRYKAQFFKALEEMNPISSSPIIRKVFLAWSQLLKEWVGTQAPVFFDFGEESTLWCLLPTKSDMWVNVAAISRHDFIELHNGALTESGQSFSELMKFINDLVFAYENPHHQHRPVNVPIQSAIQRQITIPRVQSQRYLYYLNYSRRRRGRL